ncbi:hypothetical protein LTR37_006309 [Vermiconidia calcicola]|uniref:Uncharacterized protein n=1 Tax=Vermiconidia calcicola TaxID=1690605 RepID=A0ACC3NIE3_9PEZI|nr:hypothetical protein LTR37_006309 [Vermiconidia calcicola]
MRAIQSVALGRAELVDVPEPELRSDSILVTPRYVANNPADWIGTDLEYLFAKDQNLGCDYTGVVERIGSDAKTTLKPGDKVCGIVAAGEGGDKTRGCFAERFPAYDDFCFPLPQNISEPEAATLGVGISTMITSFYIDLGFPLPNKGATLGRGRPFFVYGGSTASGLYAIQFAKLSGFRVVTTCSPRNFDLVKSRGADEVFDYHDFQKCEQEIKASVGDDLQYAYVCVMGDDPPKLCAEVLSTKGGKYITIVATPCPRNDVESKMTYGQSIMADTYKSTTGVEQRNSARRELGLKAWRMSLGLVEQGKILPPPHELREGLEGALKGIDDLRRGSISGKKIVSKLV